MNDGTFMIMSLALERKSVKSTVAEGQSHQRSCSANDSAKAWSSARRLQRIKGKLIKPLPMCLLAVGAVQHEAKAPRMRNDDGCEENNNFYLRSRLASS